MACSLGVTGEQTGQMSYSETKKIRAWFTLRTMANGVCMDNMGDHAVTSPWTDIGRTHLSTVVW